MNELPIIIGIIGTGYWVTIIILVLLFLVSIRQRKNKLLWLERRTHNPIWAKRIYFTWILLLVLGFILAVYELDVHTSTLIVGVGFVTMIMLFLFWYRSFR